MSNVVLLEVPKYLHAPDWAAFESVLRNLQKLERLPAGALTEGVYSFGSLGIGFTAEQLLDEVDRASAALRSVIQNARAATSTL